ncbi:unnamed protein product [Calypogeia fissa]
MDPGEGSADRVVVDNGTYAKEIHGVEQSSEESPGDAQIGAEEGRSVVSEPELEPCAREDVDGGSTSVNGDGTREEGAPVAIPAFEAGHEDNDGDDGESRAVDVKKSDDVAPGVSGNEHTPTGDVSVASFSVSSTVSGQGNEVEEPDIPLHRGDGVDMGDGPSSSSRMIERVDENERQQTTQCSSSAEDDASYSVPVREDPQVSVSNAQEEMKSEQVFDNGSDHQFEEVSLLDPGVEEGQGRTTIEGIREAVVDSGDGLINSSREMQMPVVQQGQDSSGPPAVRQGNSSAPKILTPDVQRASEIMSAKPEAKSPIDRPGVSPNLRHNRALPNRAEIYDHNGSFFESPQYANYENSLYPQGNYPNLSKVLPKTSPELMHVIDSAITQETDLSSLQKLQRIVAGKETLVQAKKGSGGDQDNVAGLVVDVLLAKMGIDSSLQKGSESLPPKIMLSAGAAYVAGRLLPWLPCQGQYPASLSPRTRMAKGLALVLQSCTRNRAMCSAAGLLQVLLETVRDIIISQDKKDFCWDPSPLLDALEALGSHSMTVTDLRDWLNTVVVGIPIGKAVDLMLSLERAMQGDETRGPSYSFEFDGESSGLLGPAESRWPFVSGYAVATWLYIESFADTVNTAAAAAAIAAAAAAKTGKSSAMSAAAAASTLAGEGMAHMPRLFSFLSADNHGVEAYFHGQFLVVETANGKGKKASMHFTHAFKPRQWYFVGLEHTYKQSLLGKSDSEVRLYVDGQLFEARPLEYPRVSRALGFCCIGTNPPPAMAGLQRRRRQCPLFAEMGPVYIFKEPIGLGRMARLAARGGDILPSFGNGAGVPWFANSEQAFAAASDSATLDIELGPRLHLLYHPKLLTGRLCPDASPTGASGLHRKPAEVLGHVHVAARTRPTEAVWAMGEGGPLALLPMTVAAVHKETLLPVLGDLEVSATVSLLAAPIVRILALAFQHPGNSEEMARSYAPKLLAYLLGHLVSVPAVGESKTKGIDQTRTEERDEELVAAVVSLVQAPKSNYQLKVHLYSTLLLDLKLWYRCAYGLQKKLLSTLADLAFTDASTMRGSNAVQLLLDGCRRCYWVVPEPDSLHLYAGGRSSRPVGEMNALIDELLVVVELLVGSSPNAISESDVSSLVQFVMDCPQPNQVARVLHLIYRLVVQPNSSRASVFAETLLSCGVVEMLFLLLKREADAGETYAGVTSSDDSVTASRLRSESHAKSSGLDNSGDHKKDGEESNFPKDVATGVPVVELDASSSPSRKSIEVNPQTLAEMSRSWFPSLRMDGAGERKYAGRNLGGISLSISADSASNNFRNMGTGDGIMVGIVSLVGALIAGGFLKLVSFSSAAALSPGTSSLGPASSIEGLGIAVGIGTWMMYAIRNAFQAAPKRLLTDNVYSVILFAVVRLEMGTTSRDGLSLYDSGHRFEHIDLLLVLLQSLPFASPSLQHRALQDVLFLACTHAENRTILTSMPEWPEWLLEVLITNYEVVPDAWGDEVGVVRDVEDIIYSFITIMLEYSMRIKDGWKDIEAVVHCAEWLAMIGGSSTGEQRLRREESLPIIKRRLLEGLLDFAARELQLQKMVVATAAAGVAAEGLSPQAAKAEAETVAQLSISLAENALVVLMLVEDHLRYQCPVPGSAWPTEPISPRVSARSPGPGGGGDFTEHQSLKRVSSGHFMLDLSPRRSSNGAEQSGVSLEVLASMADANGHISAAAMERLTASTAAEPYDAVRGAFVSYGTCGAELAEGWKQRSRMWYGVGLPGPERVFGGGGGGWNLWKLAVERDEHGQWVDLPLVRRSIAMLQSLLLDDSGPGGGGVGFGGGAGTAYGGAHALQQLLDSDQIFFAMLRIVLLSMREEDTGDSQSEVAVRKASPNELVRQVSRFDPASPNETLNALTMRKAKTSLLWCVLAPLITMALSETRRQRVLVAACILYSEVWHTVSEERVVLRRRYVEAIMPPFTALLRRWRPLLSGIHAFTDADGQSPLAVEDRALALDALPLEAAVSMISPAWAAAFASPPASMALAMAAAGVGGGEVSNTKAMAVKREQSRVERKGFRLRTFQKLPESPRPTTPLKDKASAKAAAVVAARDQERNAKIGSGRGLGAVAMATSSQRRNLGDKERAKRWNLMESMHTAWDECSFISADMALELTGKDIPKLQKILSAMVETATGLRTAEINRRTLSAAADEFGSAVGAHSWRSLTRRLLEIGALFGLLERQIGHPERIFYKLDPLENSMRMRRRLKRNYKGTDHYGAAADYQSPDELGLIAHESSLEAGNALISTPLPTGAPKLMPETYIYEDAGEVYARNSVGEMEDRKDEKEELQLVPDNALNDPTDMPLLREAMQSSVTNPSSLSMAAAAAAIVSEPKEKLLIEVPGAMVQLLKVLRGRFQVTTKRICFMIDDRVHVNESGVASLSRSDSQNPVDQIGNENLAGSCQRSEGAKDRVWPLSALWEIHSRRYLLRRSALEIFMVDRSNFFFNFGTEDNRRDVYKALVQARPPHLNSIYAATQRPERLLKRTQLTERWARHEITNFEYLMQLNTLAGRSFNDPTQYPIFPWVLADYTSKDLNLGDPKVYRDLSKPVGALNPDRLEKFLERYENFDDPVIPKFHYGSHYSSAGTVVYFLVRLEPYSSLAISLQGGKFDHADRMFSDIPATWNGVLEDMSDVKELVPELFYMPEILTNTNGLHLGKTQNGETLGDVKLPPWATDPVDFVHKNRLALESEYVSANLHKWIDLVFGYKQRGKEAVSANNVFFYMTYEGAVDIDKITDPVLRKATQDQITYFGQTPSQLLTTPHIERMPLEEALHLQTMFRHPKGTKIYVIPSPERLNVPAAKLCVTQDSVVTVGMEAPACQVGQHRWKPNTPDGRGSPFILHPGRSGARASSGAFTRMFGGTAPVSGDETGYPRAISLPAPGIQPSMIVAITPDGRHLLTGGHADNTLKVVATEHARVVESASGHYAPITCLALSSDGGILVTGSRDTTAIIWRIHGNTASPISGSNSVSDSSLVAAASSGGSIAADSGDSSSAVDGRRRRIEGPLHVLRGHVDELICCCVNADLDLVVTSSVASGVLLHSITRGRLLRKLPVRRADLLVVSQEGNIVSWNKVDRVLSAYTINGVSIAVKEFSDTEGSITSMLGSADGHYLAMASSFAAPFDPDSVWRGKGLPEMDSQRKPPPLCPICRYDSTLCEHSGAQHKPSSIIQKPRSYQNFEGTDPAPTIVFVKLHTLEVVHQFCLQDGQEVTAMAMNNDNTNLVVSTANGQLLVFTDPNLSVKVVDQMLRLGWEGGGLAGFLN